MPEQLRLDGGADLAAEEAALGPAQRAVLEAIREYGRVEPDEAGAILHARRSHHGRDERCGFCAKDGRRVLASLSKRGFKNGRRSRADGSKPDYDPSTAPIPY